MKRIFYGCFLYSFSQGSFWNKTLLKTFYWPAAPYLLESFFGRRISMLPTMRAFAQREKEAYSFWKKTLIVHVCFIPYTFEVESEQSQ